MTTETNPNPEGENKDEQGTGGTAGAGAAGGAPGTAGDDPKAAAAAAKIEADRKLAEEEAARDAEVDRRATAKAQKLAEKLANEKIAARELDAKQKADREKLDATEKAKLETKDAETKLAATEAKLKAAEIKAEVATALTVQKLAPANAKAFGFIQDAVKAEMDAGAESIEKALANVRNSDAFLFAQPEAAPAGAAGKPKPANNAGAPGGPGERPAGDQTGAGKREYQTKPPGEIDPNNLAELNRSVQERWGFTLSN